jgi:hypothetical protein
MPKQRMPVAVSVAVAIVLFVGLLFVVDRAVKAVKRVRRRREANRRLVAAAAVAEAKHRKRTAAVEASGALTSVMPTIHDIDTRVVDQPALRPDGTPGRP